MPLAIVAVVGIAATGWALKEGGELVDSSARLMRIGVAAGAVYLVGKGVKAW